MTTKNPMSSPDPWTLVAEGYVTDTKPLFEQYCNKALELVGYSGAGKILDVACGPGTLSLLISRSANEIHSIDFSQGMLDCFNREISRSGIRNIKTWLMDGQNLEFGDNEFDFAFSIFGLMFFPDRVRGFREIWRTLKPGGRVAVASWAPVTESTGMQLMFGAIQAAFPKKPESSDRKILNLENRENFKVEMEAAGFTDICITPHDGYWEIDDTENFLDSMVRGSAPLAMIKQGMGEKEWLEKYNNMLSYLHNNIGTLPARISNRALIGTGVKP